MEEQVDRAVAVQPHRVGDDLAEAAVGQDRVRAGLRQDRAEVARPVPGAEQHEEDGPERRWEGDEERPDVAKALGPGGADGDEPGLVTGGHGRTAASGRARAPRRTARIFWPHGPGRGVPARRVSSAARSPR
jgi:hypothetical protein